MRDNVDTETKRVRYISVGEQILSRRGYPAGEQILRRGEEIDILPIEIWEEIDMVPS